jgi:hypothetical protein
LFYSRPDYERAFDARDIQHKLVSHTREMDPDAIHYDFVYEIAEEVFLLTKDGESHYVRFTSKNNSYGGDTLESWDFVQPMQVMTTVYRKI